MTAGNIAHLKIKPYVIGLPGDLFIYLLIVTDVLEQLFAFICRVVQEE